ncbi:transposable element Tcb1 transposase [Trichonephila clavipes]|uniref:Transposable element Tcb1 transposase n=1 Tax=Trichonephila clavipes TaxID=2585209 RepID=A0A8X6RI29_TRICX|nr:transposable element Tcb1 transposase [Trichonephila clavipes]
MVKETDSGMGRQEFEPSTADDSLCRGGRCTLNIPRLKRPQVVDEAWLYYYDPTIKQQSSEWKHPSSSTLKKAKTVKSADKFMTIFFNYEEIVYQHAVEPGTTVNDSYYTNVLRTMSFPEDDMPRLNSKCTIRVRYFLLRYYVTALTVLIYASQSGIIGRLECERTKLEVSEELGIGHSVISRLWQRFQDDGNVSRCYSTGRSRVAMPNEDRYIYLAVTAKRNRRSTASNLSRQLSSVTGTTVSRQTVYRRLRHIGLYARRPVRCIPLTATHCRLRLTWSREHALWTPQQWSCVMFSDEYRFSLQFDSHQALIWRAPGTCYHQENTIERHRYGGAGWLVWGGIILGSRTDLHVQSATMTGHIYREVLLEQHLRLFRGAMGAEFLFMDDNARPHRANIVDMLGRRIAAVNPSHLSTGTSEGFA